MTLFDLSKAAGSLFVAFALALWAIGLSGCTHASHVRAVNAAAVTLESTASALLSEYERGRPDGDASAYAEKWAPVVHALSAAYAAHDAWRLAVESGDEAGILAAAARAHEALCRLRETARGLASVAICRSQGGEEAAYSGGWFREVVV